METIIHPLPPVWNTESRVLLLGTMPSPASREAGFFYMHKQNRFWRVLPAVFGETLLYANDGTPHDAHRAPDRNAAIAERRDFLLRHHIALWDVLSSCEIHGAADSSIKNAVPNDFHKIFERSHIHCVFCTGKTAFSLWEKFCATEYEPRYNLTSECRVVGGKTSARISQNYSVVRLVCLSQQFKSSVAHRPNCFPSGLKSHVLDARGSAAEY